ncbi:hypothetical protein QTN25_004938 [Entamoeba marina]
MNNKQLDSYSLLIVSKYFETSQDFINVICVNSKFKETTEKLRYNPISITSKKLFPKIQTQYLYNRKDKIFNDIQHHEIWYTITYHKYLKFKNNNIKCHHIKYRQQDRCQYGDDVLNIATILGVGCFFYDDHLKTITLPNNITSIGNNCFSYCLNLSNIVLPNYLKVLPSYCFQYCCKLCNFIIPPSVYIIQDNCFNKCTSLQSITIPTTINKLNDQTFMNCSSLTNIVLPTTLTSIGELCFSYCTSLTTITLPSSLQQIKYQCFFNCLNLITVNGIEKLQIANECFKGCEKIKLQPQNTINNDWCNVI